MGRLAHGAGVVGDAGMIGGFDGPHPNAVALLVDPVADVVGEAWCVAGGLAAGGGAWPIAQARV